MKCVVNPPPPPVVTGYTLHLSREEMHDLLVLASGARSDESVFSASTFSQFKGTCRTYNRAALLGALKDLEPAFLKTNS